MKRFAVYTLSTAIVLVVLFLANTLLRPDPIANTLLATGLYRYWKPQPFCGQLAAPALFGHPTGLSAYFPMLRV